MKYILGILPALIFFSCTSPSGSNQDTTDESVVSDSLRYDQEGHLKNIRQLTWGGNNAEAYWSFSGDQLIFQSDYAEWGVECDQIFALTVDQASPEQKPPMIICTSKIFRTKMVPRRLNVASIQRSNLMI